MTDQRRKTTSNGLPIETHEHVPDSLAGPAVSTESTVPHPKLRTRVDVGLFAVATVVLFGISIPFVPLPSSLGTLLVGTATTGLGERNGP